MVAVVDRRRLEDFRRTWRLHNGLEQDQLAYAGAKARVASVGFYHGGDVLYQLEGVPERARGPSSLKIGGNRRCG
jgi:hypothetical protein